MNTKEARGIIDERCSCGHLRSQHGNRYAIGHGACTAASGVMEHCPCPQFTWMSWVFKSRTIKSKSACK